MTGGNQGWTSKVFDGWYWSAGSWGFREGMETHFGDSDLSMWSRWYRSCIIRIWSWSGQPLLLNESIRIYLYENNFIELFDNLGILGEYQLEYTNLLSVASDVVAQRRSKKYGDKIAAPDDDDTVSYRDWNFQEMKSVSNRKGRKRLKKVEIKIWYFRICLWESCRIALKTG